jgi:hypothetical protein
MNKIEGYLAASELPGFQKQFLDPSTAQDSDRFCWPNAHCKPACPVYQRGVVDVATLDVGDHQARAVIVQPHAAAPIMISHGRLASRQFVLFDGTSIVGGRLIDSSNPGFAASTAADQPPFITFEIPAAQSFSIGTVLALPLHGSFGTPYNALGNVRMSVAQACFEDYTAVLNAGTDTGVRAIPCEAGDVVKVDISGTCGSAAYANGDLVLDVVTSSATGVLTTTSANIVVPVALAVPNFFGAYGQISTPAGAVGIVSAMIRGVVARFITFQRCSILHESSSGGANISTGLGVFTGASISGMNSLRAVAQEARLNSLSCLLTNTASSLNANGFITGCGIPGATPASVGIVGEDSVASAVSSRTFKFLDGSYTSLRPAQDLCFSPLDSLPPNRANRVIYFIRGQDATPVTFKIEYQAVLEVISADPLFPPERVVFDEKAMTAVERLAEGPAYLILCENALHMGKILKKVGKVAKFAAPVLGMMGAPHLASLAEAAGQAGISWGDSMEKKRKNKATKKQDKLPNHGNGKTKGSGRPPIEG